MSLSKVDMVCFSDIFWDHLWQRHQSILSRFPSGWRILYIEPTSLIILLVSPWRLLPRRIDNITVVSLPSIPLIDAVAGARIINDLWITFWLRLHLAFLRMAPSVMLFHEPRYCSVADRLSCELVVFDLVDDKMAFSATPPWMEEYHRKLIVRSDLITVTSTPLGDKARQAGGRLVQMIQNAADQDLFRKAMNCEAAGEMQEIDGPVAGFIGSIDEWFDFDLIMVASSMRPDVTFVLIGPVCSKVMASVAALKSRGNVRLLGRKPKSMLPSYLCAFDVALIPFKVNRLTASVNPVKVYEYLAAGKKVVSTPLPDIDRLVGVRIARTSDEFVRMIDRALNDSTTAEEISNGVEGMSWESRAFEMVELIKDGLKAKIE